MKKPAAKPTKKQAPAKKPASKAKKSGSANKALANKGPSKVTTGSGASAGEIARDIVAMFNAGQMKEIEDKYWSPNVVSVEGENVAMAWHGRRAVEEKNAGWMATHRMHGASAEGPFVGASGFSIKFAMDVEDTTNGTRILMEEVGVYQVQNGKIVREEFMYGRMTPVT